MHVKSACLFCTVCLLAAGAPRADAQDPYLEMFNAQNQAAVQYAGTEAVNSAITDAGENRGKRETPATDTPSAGMAFKPSRQVTRSVNKRFSMRIGERLPSERDRIGREIDSGRMHTWFDAVLSTYSLEAHDLADVSAGYYIALWEVANGRRMSRGEAAAVAAQLRKGVRADPALARLSNDERQEIAEAYGLYTAIVLRTYDRLSKAGNDAALASLRQSIKEHRQIDLESLAVTSSGFAQKN